jgi:type III pantothenate kinase
MRCRRSAPVRADGEVSRRGRDSGLLAIDVGNSETKLGFFGAGGSGDLIRTWRVRTETRTPDEFGVLFTGLFHRAQIDTDRVCAIALSSVAPQLDRELHDACVQYFHCEPLAFTAATQGLIEIRTDRPRELGSDLAAAAIGARALYGAPLIVIGFGTATTFSAVGRDGAFVGAAIAPGIQISIDALVERAAKLPQIALETPPSPVGRDTVSALQSGIVFGFVGQTEGIIARMKGEIGDDARVVATGGLADVVARHTRTIEAVEPNLVLLGLQRFFVQTAARVRGAAS